MYCKLLKLSAVSIPQYMYTSIFYIRLGSVATIEVMDQVQLAA